MSKMRPPRASTKTVSRSRAKKARPPDQEHIDTGWRLFVAVPVPDDVKVLLKGIVNYVDGKEWPVRWTNPGIAHLTMHFIGDTEPERAELLRVALPKVIRRHAPFTLQTGRLGVFPDVNQPKVLWLGLSGDAEALTALHADIGETLRTLDFPVEHRRLRPHLTVGRLREDVPPDFANTVKEKFLDPRLQERLDRSPLVVPVDEVGLMRSYVGKFGAKHVPVVVAKLEGT